MTGDNPLELAEHVVQMARRGGADAADAIYDRGVEFSVTIRRDEIENGSLRRREIECFGDQESL